jgi:hypothetical protein
VQIKRKNRRVAGCGAGLGRVDLQFAGEGFGEDGGHEDIKLLGAFRLHLIQGVDYGLDVVEDMSNPLLVR